MTAKELTGGSRVVCGQVDSWGKECLIGPDVIIQCERLTLGNNASIGWPENDTGFRYPGGVRVNARHLILGDHVKIGRQVFIRGGDVEFGRRVKCGANTTIDVKRRFVVGAGGTIGEDCQISGVDIRIGRQLWMLPSAKIGGGSAMEIHSRLEIGNWCHLGMRTLLNTARPIAIGDEVGLGTGTSLYTHGAYASVLDGKPVSFGPITIGDRSWLPGAVVNPGVTIGKDCVIGVGSVVTRDVPDGSLAAGMPAKIIKERAYPATLSDEERFAFFVKFLQVFCEICSDSWEVGFQHSYDCVCCTIGETILEYRPKLSLKNPEEFSGVNHKIFLIEKPSIMQVESDANATVIDLSSKTITGKSTVVTERLLNHLRRYGIRFNYDSDDGEYVAWL